MAMQEWFLTRSAVHLRGNLLIRSDVGTWIDVAAIATTVKEANDYCKLFPTLAVVKTVGDFIFIGSKTDMGIKIREESV